MFERKSLWVIVAAILVLGSGGYWVVQSVRTAQNPERKPKEPVWGKDECAHCQMHVTEAPFAAQAQLQHGETVFFDDPGCYFRWLRDGGKPVAVWFRHSREETWLHEDETAFVRADATPMGFGLAAVREGEPGAMSVQAAEKQALAPKGSL
jgi:hypothetical protein